MANSPRNALFAWRAALRTLRQRVAGDGTSPAEPIDSRARTRGAVLKIVLLAIIIGSLSIAANPPGPQSVEGKDAEPITPVTGSVQPSTAAASPEPTLDPGPQQPSAEASTPEPIAETAPPEPTKDAGSGPAANTEPPPSLEAVPVGDLPGWKQVFVEDFTDGDVPLGGFPGIYGSRWHETYSDGAPDTHAKTQAKDQRTSGYYPSKVLSVHDGVLDMFLHSENGVSMGAAPSPRFAGANQPPYNSQLYGRYSVRFKADSLPGF